MMSKLRNFLTKVKLFKFPFRTNFEDIKENVKMTVKTVNGNSIPENKSVAGIDRKKLARMKERRACIILGE